MLYFWIMLGSALGGAARYWFSGGVSNSIGETFPWGTMLVNISGSFVIGFFSTLTGPDGRLLVSTTARQFVMIGLCGGYTTLFLLQPANAQSRARRRMAAGRCQWRPIAGPLFPCGVAWPHPRRASEPNEGHLKHRQVQLICVGAG